MSDRFARDKTGFDVPPGGRLVYGPGVADKAGEVVRSLGLGRVLLVTDPGVVAAGHAERVRASLERAGVTAIVYAEARPEPTTRDVDECLAALAAKGAGGGGIDGFVSVGGGSTIDTAKAAAFLLANGGALSDYRGFDKAPRPLLPHVAVPTTAGTGSEVQSFAVVAEADGHKKMACGAPSALPRAAILDPTLTLTLPRAVTAATGIDALTHAVETAVTRARSALSLVHSHAAFKLLSSSLARVLVAPDDLDARGRMLLGSAHAGIAIEQSMLGATHAAANPVSARTGLIHGHAVGAMLLPVARWNAEDPVAHAAYAELARAAGLVSVADSDAQAVEALLGKLAECLAVAEIPPLAACGIATDDVPALASLATAEWTGGFNPRATSAAAFEHLYRVALAAPGTARGTA